MSKKIYYQFDGTDQVWMSEEYNLELNINQTRSEMGLPYWTDYKIIQPDDRINPISDPNPKIDTSNPSDSGSPQPTAISKRSRKTKNRS